MDNDKPLNYCRSLFAEYYTDGDTKGNATQSALKAGYTYKYADQACRWLLGNSRIKQVIEKKTAEIRDESIATRKIRQEFWTREMNNPNNKLTDRLRASELLGKSEADFTENYTDKTADQPEEFSDEELAELKRLAGIATNIKIHKPQAV